MSGVRIRRRGVSARMKLTATMSLLVIGTGLVLLAVVYLFLLRYIPPGTLNTAMGDFAPSRRDLVQAFLPRALWAMVLLVVFSTLACWFIAGYLLRPLARIQSTSNNVRAGQLGWRVRLPGPRTEFTDVGDAMDLMLDQLEEQLREQRRFAANASHELRTPLAALRTTLEVGPTQELPEAEFTARLQEITGKAERSVESLLTLSKAQGAGLVKKPTDISLLLEDVVEQYLPQAIARGLSFETDTGRQLPLLELNADLLEHAIANLVRNAIAYAHGRIWLSTAARRGRLEIRVSNDGQQLSEEQATLILEPFQRLARHGGIKDTGSGLGLPIVAAVAKAHEADLELRPRAGGGLDVVLGLPLPRS